eukprot:5445062-Amphidinium_carterae.1
MEHISSDDMLHMHAMMSESSSRTSNTGPQCRTWSLIHDPIAQPTTIANSDKNNSCNDLRDVASRGGMLAQALYESVDGVSHKLFK